jgi:hypothetical protein
VSIGHKVPQVFHPDDNEHRRQIAQCLNGVMQGQLNNTLTVTLAANAATTTVSDARIGSTSILLPMPTTANAAAALGGLYVTGIAKQTAVLNHANNAQVDKTFVFAIVG